jgi:translocation and assembly module TamB
MVTPIKRFVRISAKAILLLLVFIILLLGVSYIYINTDSGKHFVANQVQTFLAKKLKTKFTIGSINYHLPNEISLQNIYLQSPNNDSLLYAGELSVNIALFKLLNGETVINNIDLKNTFINVSRTENDSNFNFQFIINAFASKPKKEVVSKDTNDLQLNLKKVNVSNVILRFNDAFAGSVMYANVDSLALSMNECKFDKLKFDINNLYADGLTFNSASTKKVASKTNTTSPSNALKLNANKVVVNNVNVSITDTISGFFYANAIRKLQMDKASVSMDDNKIAIENFLLHHSSFTITTMAVANTANVVANTTTIPWSVKVNQIDFFNNNIIVNNNKVPVVGFDANHINITEMSLHTKDVYYSNDSTSAFVDNVHLKDHSGFRLDTMHAKIVYSTHQINATELYIKTPKSVLQNSLQLSFDSLQTITTYPEKSSIAVNLQNTEIAFDDVFLILPQLKKNASLFKWQHEVVRIDSKIYGTLQQLYINQLACYTKYGTAFSANGKLTNVTDTKKLVFDVNILPSAISKMDISKFVVLDQRSSVKLPSLFMLQGNASGNVNELETNIALKANNFLLDTKVKLLSIINPKKLSYDATINALSIQKDLIIAIVPKDKMPQNIELPNVILANGKVNGDLNNITTNIHIDGSFGKISANGFVKNFLQPKKAIYNIDIESNRFLIGKLLMQDSIFNAVSMRTTIIGKSFELQNMTSSVQAKISQLDLKQYNYSNIQINAKMYNGALQSTGSVSDPNLKLHFEANTNNMVKPSNLVILLQLDTARLHQLHITKDTLDIATSLSIKANDLSMNNLTAIVLIDSVSMTMNKKRMKLDSILVVANKEKENQKLTVQSPIVKLKLIGNFEYDKVVPAFINFTNHYYHLVDSTPQKVNSQKISFDGLILEHPFVKSFVPTLTNYDSITFSGNFNSNNNDSGFQFSVLAPFVNYNNNKINNTALTITTTAEQMLMIASVDSAYSNQSKFYNTQCKASITHDSLHIDAYTKNKNGKDRYAFGGVVAIKNKEYTAHLNDRLILNNQKWSIQPFNKIFYSPLGFYVSNCKIATNLSMLSIQSEQEKIKSPIHVEIKNFSISDITSVLNKDTLLASGVINGNFNVSEFDKKLPAFEGDLAIDQLFVNKNIVGNIALETKKIDDNTIHANVTIKENENDVMLNGNYFLNNTDKQIEAEVIINKFNMATLAGFSNGNITNANGTLNGKVNVKGKFAEPIWDGKINFIDPAFRLQKFGTAYRINKQSIEFNYPNILFNQFTITDSANHNLVLDGTIVSKSISDYNVSMNIDSKDFIVVNTPRSTNDYIFGFAGVNANLNIKGNFSKPIIQGSFGLNDETDATLLLPQQSENRNKGKSVVRFIDRDTFALPEHILFTPFDSSTSNQTMLKYNVNVGLSKKASLTVIVDPSTGDELKVSGDAKLNVGIDEGGNILLVGNYDLVKGHYILHYQFLKRQFDLLPQSTILFSGNPLDAQLDIRAEYTANTSAIDLVGNELGDADLKTINTFNQKIPFKVLLYIKGTMKKLDISFDIKMPDENSGLSNTIITTVENKLTQLRTDPSSINKQVFSLLVLNRFVGEQSSDFFKGNGGGVEEIARESVSKFLSAALDQIAADLVKGVDVDVKLNSYKDFSSGAEQQRSDLNVGVTKRFMDDRLSINIGKDFGVEGDDNSSKARSSTSALYMPNAIVNYKLSKDGRYAVRAYSKSKFEVILDGYVVESGLSFLVTMDYEKFKELFENKVEIN